MGDFGGDGAEGKTSNVSTELKLQSPADEHIEQQAKRIRSFGTYSREEEEEETRLGLSTRLKLRVVEPWELRKVLTESDCNALCRLIVPQKNAQNIMNKHWEENIRRDVETGRGVQVRVWDYDTETEHSLEFKKLNSSGSYEFKNNWSRDFIRRRGLREGDEIGMFWDNSNSRFGFRVLVKAYGSAVVV